jgi:MoxR-like ATPase
MSPAVPALAFAAPYQELLVRTQTPTPLLRDERFHEAGHTWSDAERHAVAHAWASQVPLLVRGEAGCGKSQLARAVAAVLQVPLEVAVIHPRFEASDLKYTEDPVRRLAQAQVVSALRPEGLAGDDLRQWVETELNPGEFITHGPIWRAFKQAVAAGEQAHWPSAVLLIDEIDKADADVPNALLDVLAQHSFTVPATGEVVRAQQKHPPLVIITTNEDRELPAAFLRRCAVLNLQPPEAEHDEEAFLRWLKERASAHKDLNSFGSALDPALSPLHAAAKQTWADRRVATKDGLPTVGLAEYLDLLYSLHALAGGNPAQAMALLGPLSAYALVKHRETPQNRAAVLGHSASAVTPGAAS